MSSVLNNQLLFYRAILLYEKVQRGKSQHFLEDENYIFQHNIVVISHSYYQNERENQKILIYAASDRSMQKKY